MFTTFVHRLRGRLATGMFDFGPDVIADCTGSEFGRLAGAGVAGLRRSLVWAFGSLTTSGLGPFSESNANTNASYAFFPFSTCCSVASGRIFMSGGDAFRPESSDARDGHAEVTRQIQQYANERVLRRYPSDHPYQDHTKPVEYEQKLVSHAGSNRSLRSASTLGDRSTGEEDEIPRHGVLNRGGQFAFKMDGHPGGSSRQVGTHVVSGSSRTLSSMSSIEEDRLHINGQLRQSSKKQLAGRIPSNPALYEHADEGSTSNISRASGAPSQTSSRNMSNRSSEPETLSEEQYIGRIHLAGQELDYRELLHVLREAMNSPAVVKEGFEEISCLQLNGEDHEYLTDLGAPHLIADAMQAHVRSIDVQLWGCGAIWNMTGTVRAQLAFVDAGALDLILAAMDNFLDNIDVQEKAIAALSNLGAAEDNLEFLLDRGAVGRIVEAMNKHSDVASIQIKGCSAMTNFASHVSPLKRQIMDLGGGGGRTGRLGAGQLAACQRERSCRRLGLHSHRTHLRRRRGGDLVGAEPRLGLVPKEGRQ